LHQAVLSSHENIVRLLVERGARLDIKDTIYKSTPLGWAQYLDRPAIVEYLSAAEAKPWKEERRHETR
jgi:peptide-methionine (S)-S-oxide reductase